MFASLRSSTFDYNLIIFHSCPLCDIFKSSNIIQMINTIFLVIFKLFLYPSRIKEFQDLEKAAIIVRIIRMYYKTKNNNNSVNVIENILLEYKVI